MIINKKLLSILIVSGLCCAMSSLSRADDLNDIKQYLRNFGGYVGYNLPTDPTTIPPTTSFDFNDIMAVSKTAITDFISSIPISNGLIAGDLNNSFGAINQLLQQSPNPNWLFANYTTESESTISANPSVDQQPFQQDPVSQAVLNLASTPDVTYCTESGDNSTPPKTDCSYLYNYKIMQNILGYDNAGQGVPSFDNFVKGTAIKDIIPELNPNTLIGPLIYNNTSSNSAASTSSPFTSGGSTTPTPMKGVNQLQQANNYIRYVTNLTNPVPLADFKTYTGIITAIQNPGLKVQDRLSAASKLLNYMTSMRTYTAQIAVAVSNYYYILGKRIKNSSTGTSQAYDEYIMATRRLYNPDSKNSNVTSQWIQNMETAAPVELERQILFTLADMNYQMYQDRMQNERILLALSTLIIQSAGSSRSSITLEAVSETEQTPGTEESKSQ